MTAEELINIIETTNMSLREVGDRAGISHEGVRYIYERKSGKKYIEVVRNRRTSRQQALEWKKFKKWQDKKKLDKALDKINKI